jgi:hypothetical protein
MLPGVGLPARCLAPRFLAETLKLLQKLEKERGITPDPAVDAFMKASVSEV